MRTAIVRLVVGASVLGLTSACAPYTEQERYQQADRLNLAREQYVVEQERCEQLGGSMVMHAQHLQEPGFHEYSMAKCARR